MLSSCIFVERLKSQSVNRKVPIKVEFGLIRVTDYDHSSCAACSHLHSFRGDISTVILSSIKFIMVCHARFFIPVLPVNFNSRRSYSRGLKCTYCVQRRAGGKGWHCNTTVSQCSNKATTRRQDCYSAASLISSQMILLWLMYFGSRLSIFFFLSL